MNFGFIRCVSNYSVFVKRAKRGCVILIAYFDDIVITSTVSIHETKSWLQSELQIKDLSERQYFLGTEISRKHEGIFLSKRNLY